MDRIKVAVPEEFSFSTIVPIRITDINYGGHVGNDTILSLLHEIRVQFLKHYGLSEFGFGDVGLIMSNVLIEFKKELFYGDNLKAYVAIANFSKVSFDIYYKLVKNDAETIVALAQTNMVCYDYERKKMAAVPEEVKELFT
jgi:acyl-CoA thioester hydrolase